jgi:hypothetical protein
MSRMGVTKLTFHSLIVLQYLDRQTCATTLAEMVDAIPFSISDDAWDVDADTLRAAIVPAIRIHLIAANSSGSGSARSYEITATGRDFLQNFQNCMKTCGIAWQELEARSAI